MNAISKGLFLDNFGIVAFNKISHTPVRVQFARLVNFSPSLWHVIRFLMKVATSRLYTNYTLPRALQQNKLEADHRHNGLNRKQNTPQSAIFSEKKTSSTSLASLLELQLFTKSFGKILEKGESVRKTSARWKFALSG